MRVDRGHFVAVEAGALPGFVMRVYAEGGGFRYRAKPLMARVGAQAVEQIFMAPDGSGFSGLLAQTPSNGDRLFVRYADEPEVSTPVVFGPELVG
jgi:hypothetical protein